MKRKKLLSVIVAAALSLGCFSAVSIASWAEEVGGAVTETSEEGVTMYRLYNPNSGEHFYTKDESEKANLVKEGWSDEGIGWTAPAASSMPVYRLYNENAGDHHYTLNSKEKDNLIIAGWKSEGIGWYSDDKETVPLYREYNPNAVTGTHNYTTDKAEHDNLVKAGWIDEGIGWYGIAAKDVPTGITQTVRVANVTELSNALTDAAKAENATTDYVISLSADVTTTEAIIVPENVTLSVPADTKLTFDGASAIAGELNVESKGSLEVNGDVDVTGTLTCAGKLSGEGEIKLEDESVLNLDGATVEEGVYAFVAPDAEATFIDQSGEKKSETSGAVDVVAGDADDANLQNLKDLWEEIRWYVYDTRRKVEDLNASELAALEADIAKFNAGYNELSEADQGEVAENYDAKSVANIQDAIDEAQEELAKGGEVRYGILCFEGKGKDAPNVTREVLGSEKDDDIITAAGTDSVDDVKAKVVTIVNAKIKDSGYEQITDRDVEIFHHGVTIYLSVIEYTYKDYTYVIRSNEGCTITKYSGLDKNVVIPSKIEDNPVIAIGREAFYDNRELTSLTVPDTVQSIDGYAFKNCISLKNVSLGKNVEDLGYGCFSNCDSLTSIYLPKSITSSGSGTGRPFENCDLLKTVTIEKGGVYVPSSMFGGCEALEEIIIPEGIERIGSNAFDGCSSLKKITLPNSLKELGDKAFVGCKSLIEISLPQGIETIGYYAFLGCEALKDIFDYNEKTEYPSGLISNNTEVTLHGYPGSNAEVYAKKNNIAFAPLTEKKG